VTGRPSLDIRWRVPLHDGSDIVVARRCTRELASQQGLSAAQTEALATAVTEIAQNILVHAGTGEIHFAAGSNASTRGVVVIARDSGPGIADAERAMQDGFSTRGSLGFGLPGARRLVDEFELESTVGVGTTVTLRKWAGAASS
jgi:serine/threonine-protein kinase RsbT